MSHVMAQVVFPSITGLPEDVFVNTFHFDSAVGPSGTIDTTLEEFFNDTHAPGGAPLAAAISNVVSRSGCRIKQYDMTDPIPRAPVSDTTFTLGAAGVAVDFPNEVALCLSYKGTTVGGIPLARQRGRIYIGPLTNANSATSGGDLRPNSTRLNIWDGAGTWLMGLSSPQEWCVFSQAALDDGHATGLFPVTSGWVDDAYDTQRRRGGKTTSRQTF